MDSFMDKLAQKFNAQEMIKANSEAEQKELQKVQEQASEYKSYLEEMKKLNQENAELTEKIEALTKQLQRVTEAGQAQIALMSKEHTQEVTRLSKESQEQMEKMVAHSTESVSRMLSSSVEKMNQVASEGMRTVSELANIQEEKLQSLAGIPGSDLSNVEENVLLLKENFENEKKRLADLFEQTNEYVHRENVKVYRNVQAVVVEEVKNRTEEITTQMREQTDELGDRLTVVEKSTAGMKPAVKATMVFSIIAAIGALSVTALYVLTMLGIL